MHFVKAGGNPADLWTKLNAHVTASMWNQTITSSKIVLATITPLDGSGVTLPQPTGAGANWAGNQSPGDIIPSSAVVIKTLTAKRGRSYRGRHYLPWPAESQCDSGQFTSGTRNASTAAWIAFHAAMVADGWTPVVASYKLSTADPIIAVAAEIYLGTVRRRQFRTANT